MVSLVALNARAGAALPVRVFSLPLTQAQIEALATGAAEVSTDAGTVKQRPADEVVTLDRYAAGKGLADDPSTRLNRMLPKARLVPPGSV